jgi:hypothetical protein
MKKPKLIVTALILTFFSGINFVFAEPILFQTISFSKIEDKKTTSPDFQVNAISDSLLPVVFSREDNSGDNACDVTEQGLVHIIKEGTCTIYANQEGNEQYLKADQVARSFKILPPGPNQVPLIMDTKFGTIDENQSFTGTFTGSDLDDDQLIFSATKPAHGTITNIILISNSESTFVYTPDKNFHGSDTFTFKANDGKIDSEVAVGSINVTYIPQIPEINLLGDNPLRLYVGDTFSDPGATAFDEDGNDLNAMLSMTNDVDTSVVGTYTVVYSVSDLMGFSNSATRTVQVSVKNNAPAVDLTNPINNSTISGTVVITASSSDDNVVTDIKFYVDGIATSSTLNTNYLTNATHTISVVVSDAEPLYATSSISVRVNNVVIPPVITSTGGGGGGGSYVAPVQNYATTTATITQTVAASTSLATTTKQVGLVLGASTFNFKKNMSFGVKNNDVKELQKILIDLKFLKTAATGYFGPATKKSLIEWQKSNGLPATGYFGPMSRALLNG